MRRTLLLGFVGTFILLTTGNLFAADSAKQTPVRIGAVAYGPRVVTVFQGIKQYLTQRGLPADFVLYSNYDSLVKALDHGEVDIAWNTPLAHAQFHLCSNGKCRTLVMRDVDKNFRAVLVVRSDADIDSIKALKNKTLCLGSPHAAEATVLPLYYLQKQHKFSLNDVDVLDLSKEKDFRGNPCCSPCDVLKALKTGRAQAGIISERLWKQSQDDSKALKVIWTSPAFSHCVFTASSTIDPDIAKTFTKLMTTMKPNHPQTGEIMRLEGTRKWLTSSPDGFADLVEALQKN